MRDLDADQQENEEFDEEDVWIAEEIERQERELQEDQCVDGDRYVPQLMNTLEMRTLQSALRRTEAQFDREGRMREYTPRRPATSSETAVYALRRPRHSSAGSSHYSFTTGGERAPPSPQNAATGRDDGSKTARSEQGGGHQTAVTTLCCGADGSKESRAGAVAAGRIGPSARCASTLQLLRVARRGAVGGESSRLCGLMTELEQRYSEMKRVLLDVSAE